VKKLLNFTFLFLFSISFYGQIQSYYNGLDLTKTENELFLELSTRVISTHSAIPYTGSPIDVWEACRQADEDPDIPENVLLIYGYDDNDGLFSTDRTRLKTDKAGSTYIDGKWNREHVFPKSLANPGFETDSPGPGTDVHNLRPADQERNSSRSNRKFTDGIGNSGIVTTNGGWYPGDEWKGDVARIIMYMYLRYNGDGSQVSETSCLPINVGFGTTLTNDSNMVDLFLKWNVEDPVSDFETDRNEVLFGIQQNRNPFIDNPYLATVIWGGLTAEDKWWSNNSSDTEAPTAPTNLNSFNVTDESFDISWSASTDNVGVYDYLVYLDGVYLQSATSTSTTISDLNPDTSYTITIKARDIASNFSVVSSVLNVSTLVGPKILLVEEFEDCGNSNFFTYSEESNKDWACEVQFGENNSGSMGINGYQQDVLSKDWLITKNSIDFDTETGEKISFYADAAYGTTPLLLVYSSDYDGTSNPSGFTWTSVPNITIPVHSNGSGTEEVFTFKDVDISSITGTVYFAFKYYSDQNPTRWTVDSFEIVADNDNPDIDGDGVLNIDDLCPETPVGETVDINGCSYGQLDDDNDGVQNNDDLCSATPNGESVNANGCSESQLDDDNDGVMNNIDLCSNTPIGETVDVNGCSNGQLDDDNDGVQNSDDLCSATPNGESVNANGCSESQLDDDNDGVMNDVDVCPNTPDGESGDTDGCSNSQLDDDNDGVMNNIDQCPSTTEGALVTSLGCFTLPFDNFNIQALSETCPNKNNGQITITAIENYNYSATINGVAYNFTNEGLTIENLTPDNYNICITVVGETYEQCYTMVIESGTEISGKVSVASNRASVEVEGGTAPFIVYVNKEELFKTNSTLFSVAIKWGDLVEVKTAKTCEGVFSKTIELTEAITAYPNPTKGIFEIALPISTNEVTVELYTIQSHLISIKTYPVNYGKIQLSLGNKPAGLYIAKVHLDKPVVLKIIKN
jgi:endonuclease I